LRARSAGLTARRFGCCLIRVGVEWSGSQRRSNRVAQGGCAAHLVDGVADQLHHIKAVEGDLGLGEVLGYTSDEGRAHVDTRLLDARGISAAVFEMIGELAYGVGAAAVGHEYDAVAVDVDHQGNVVLAALCSCLVDANALDVGKIGACDGGLNVVEDDAPQR
jgi:hypothetical protein